MYTKTCLLYTSYWTTRRKIYCDVYSRRIDLVVGYIVYCVDLGPYATFEPHTFEKFKLEYFIKGLVKYSYLFHKKDLLFIS